ncbi:MAG: DUF192 domain-containing protein [Betaproteobacteria bacterium]|nr:DUF192 domain-containing protein [Betaproteobacteria bacterium]
MRSPRLTTLAFALTLAGCAHSPAHRVIMSHDRGGIETPSSPSVVVRDLKNGELVPPTLSPSLMWHLSNEASPASSSAHERPRPHSSAFAIADQAAPLRPMATASVPLQERYTVPFASHRSVPDHNDRHIVAIAATRARNAKRIIIVGQASRDSAKGLAGRQQLALRRALWVEKAPARRGVAPTKMRIFYSGKQPGNLVRVGIFSGHGATGPKKGRPCVDVVLEADPSHHWCVEVALTVPQLHRGLSGRTWLPHDGGMLFAHDHPQRLYYWMKNTYLPLDIIFLSPQRVVTRIYRNARPMDKTLLDGGVAQYVIELPGGSTTRDHVHVGSHFQFPPRRQLIAIMRAL